MEVWSGISSPSLLCILIRILTGLYDRHGRIMLYRKMKNYHPSKLDPIEHLAGIAFWWYDAFQNIPYASTSILPPGRSQLSQTCQAWPTTGPA